MEIRDIERLLLNSLPLNTTIKGYTTEDLVEPGENYGSHLISVSVEIEDSSNTTSKLQLVGKMIPKNEWLRQQFNTEMTFRREITMYQEIGPALLEFQIEQESDPVTFMPKCYATRVSLNPESTVVDDDAIIVLEDLTASGFIRISRLEGFDFEAAKVVLKSMATFHAAVVSFKNLKPDFFKKNMLPHLTMLDLFVVSEDVGSIMVDNIYKIAESNEECVHLIDNMKKGFARYMEFRENKIAPREPFATIMHNDLWTNNLMIKPGDGDSAECRLLDFQTIVYGSPCRDLVFFLYTSVKEFAIEERFNYLRDYYFSMFICTLENLKCDITPFKYDLFLLEFEEAAKIEFSHIMFMLNPILGLKSDKSIDEMTELDMISTELESIEYKEKLPHVVLDFFRKGWI